MDFVVVGLGIGALAVLLGLALRDLGPFVRRIPRDGWMPWAEVAARVAWGGRCRAMGLVVAIAGAWTCVVTGVALLARVNDGTGMWIVLGAIAVALIGVAVWAIRFHMFQSARHLAVAPVVETVAWSPRTPDADEPVGQPARRSAMSGIRGRAATGRRRRDPLAGGETDQESVERRPQMVTEDAESVPIGALSVDESGSLRRAPFIRRPPDSAVDTQAGTDHIPATAGVPRSAPSQTGMPRGQAASQAGRPLADDDQG